MNAFAPTWSRSPLRRTLLTPVAMAAFALTLIVTAVPARATTIQRVVSPGGIEAWLVQEQAVPLIAVDFAFTGGSVQDPPGKSGTANLVASLLDEGAGDLDSKAFADALERKAIEMSFHAERDHLGGALRTLTENRDEAFDMLRLALTAPRFDTADVELNRAQILSMLRRQTTSPEEIAGRRWWETAFAGHPYGRPVSGTPETLQAVTVDDLKSYAHRVLARQNLKIAVVGDIDAETLKPLARSRIRRAAGDAGFDARGQCHAGRRRPTDRCQPRCAAGGGRFRRSRHCTQGSRLHGRLCHQSYPRRRLV